MVDLEQHPTVQRIRASGQSAAADPQPMRLDAAEIRQLCLDTGADDVGFVDISRPEIATEQAGILALFPHARTLISFVLRMNREDVRSPARSIANLEFHHTGHEIDEVARRIVHHLEQRGVRAIHPAMGFPMEADRWPAKMWVISHKTVAVAAGLGHMGIHRNVIHPKFGNFILLGTVVTDAEITAESQPLDYNPCVECKLCVAACPTGAISPDGHFNFSACYTHNYREFMGGFVDWVENIASSTDSRSYRRKVSDPETISMWQSLSFGANYKAAYCMAVCPAGEDVMSTFLDHRETHLDDIVRPLQQRVETVYVVAGSDAEQYVKHRYPHKRTKRVSNGTRPHSIETFLNGLPLAFQRKQAEGLDATYHFTFTGRESSQATVVIQNNSIEVKRGHVGEPGLRVTADTETWLGFLAKETSLVWALLSRKIRLKGSPRLLLAFGKCFPS